MNKDHQLELNQLNNQFGQQMTEWTNKKNEEIGGIITYWEQYNFTKLKEQDGYYQNLMKDQSEKWQLEIMNLSKRPIQKESETQTQINYLSDLEYNDHINEIDQYIQLKDISQLKDELKNKDKQILELNDQLEDEKEKYNEKSSEKDYNKNSKGNEDQSLCEICNAKNPWKCNLCNKWVCIKCNQSIQKHPCKQKCFNENSLFPISNEIIVVETIAK